MAERFFQQNNFSSGLSESETSGGQGYFSQSWGIDIHTIPGVVRAAVMPQKESGTVVVDFCKFAIDVSRGTLSTHQESLWFGDAGNIYRRTINVSGLVSWGSVYQHSPLAIINGAWEFNNYIYWTSGGSVHRISVDDAIPSGQWTSGSITLNWGVLNNTEYHPSVIIGTYNLIANGTTIASIDDTGTITANGIPDVSIAHLPASYEITSLHRYGIDVLAGTKNKGGVTGTKLLRWDLASPAFTQDIDVPEHAINCFLTTSNRTYLQVGKKGKIYEYNGASVSPYKTIPNNENKVGGDAGTYPQSSANYEGIGYLGVSDLSATNEAMPIPGLYALGRRNDKYPISLSHQFVPSAATDTSTDIKIGAIISGHFYNVGFPYLVFAWKKEAITDVFGVDAIHNSANKFTGAYIETQSVGGNRHKQKTFGNLVIPYKLLPASTNITMSYYKNFATSSSGSITLVNKSAYNTLVSDEKIEAGAMKYKIILSTNSTDSPELEGFYTDWNEKSVF